MKKIFSIFFVLVSFLSVVSALGVASPYWKDNPLLISPGESVIINLNLQNVVGDEDVYLKVTLLDNGGGIAKLLDGERIYLLLKGTYDTYVPLEIKIPSNRGYEKVEVKVEFTPTSREKSGDLVDLSTSFTQIIPVEITSRSEIYKIKDEPVQKKEENKPFFTPTKTNIFIWIFILLGLIIITFIIIKIIRKRKEKTYTQNFY